MTLPKLPDTFSFDEVCTDLLGIESFSDWLDDYDSYACAPYDSSLTDEQNWAIADEEREQDAKRYMDACIQVARNILREHKLDLVESHSRERGTFYRVVPLDKWSDALTEVVQTINGVGYFHFASSRELLRSGPYASPKQGVLSHLHWVKRHGEVYGCGTPRSMLDRVLR